MVSTTALTFVLDVLDDGLRLYRRHFRVLLAIVVGDLIPLWILALAWGLLVRGQWALFVLVISYPALLRTIIRLSHASLLVAHFEPMQESALQPLRLYQLLGMIGYSMVWSVAPTLLAAAFTSLIERGAHDIVFGAVMRVLLTFLTGQSALLLARAMTHDLYILTLPSVWLASHIFVMQPYVLERRPWHSAAIRCNDILLFRFGHSILLLCCVGTLLTAVGLTYLGSCLVILERIGRAPNAFSFMRSPFDSLLPITLWGSLLVLLIPPLTLWITLFYRRSAAEHDHDDLVQRISTWLTYSSPKTESLLSLER